MDFARRNASGYFCIAGSSISYRKEMPTAIRWNQKVAVWTQKFALMIVGHVEKRMAKAYPVILENGQHRQKKGTLQKGAGFLNCSGCF